MAELDEIKSELFKKIFLNLGGGLVDVELDPEHYEYALIQALEVYRQKSSRAVEESILFLNLIEDQQEYILPQEVINVKQIHRRSIGSSAGTNTTTFEPFEAGFVNTYLLQSGRVGGLASYEMYAQYQELTSRMFGGYINFNFNTVSKKLTIVRHPRGSEEDVLLEVYNYKPDVMLLQDTYAYPWIKEYTQALCKKSLGEAREKFATIAGPAGGTVLNGSSLKAEAIGELEKLMMDMINHVDGSDPLGFIIG